MKLSATKKGGEKKGSVNGFFFLLWRPDLFLSMGKTFSSPEKEEKTDVSFPPNAFYVRRSFLLRLVAPSVLLSCFLRVM